MFVNTTWWFKYNIYSKVTVIHIFVFTIKAILTNQLRKSKQQTMIKATEEFEFYKRGSENVLVSSIIYHFYTIRNT